VRLLLTRPEADAARTASSLRALGHAVIVTPLLRIETLSDAELGAGPWAAILVTSANAVRSIAVHPRRGELRAVPMLTVGPRTAQALRAAGFADVTSADGDVNDLAALVAARIKPQATLLYLAGEQRSGDLAGDLRARNFTVHSVIIYRAVVAEKLPDHAAAAFAAGIDGVLHFSRRSAEAYLDAARGSGLLAEALKTPVHFCLSARVAEPLTQAGAADIRIAARPEEAALLALCG
jgi:uroporphyrinogen-III synthase